MMMLVASLIQLFFTGSQALALSKQTQWLTSRNDATISVQTDLSLANKNINSPFLNKWWRLQMDFGLEPGSFMPQSFPEWGASGARLGVPLELLFTSNRLDKIPDNCKLRFCGHSESNGNPLDVFEVQVSPTFKSTFVSKRGEEAVEFKGGGYYMDRSFLSTLSNDNLPTPKPRFLLRFWIDCVSGATRNDLSVEPNTRIFGTIPIWDDPDQIAQLKEELVSIRTRNNSDEVVEPTTSKDASSLLERILDFRGNQKQENDEESLSYRQEQIERLLPLPGSNADGDSGVTFAPKGSLVMPYDEENNYLIIGTFTMRAPR